MLKALVTVCLAGVLASPAFAQMKDMPAGGNMGHHGPGSETCDTCGMDGPADMMGGMMGKCLQYADKLGLTDDQINRIKPIHREMQKKQARFKADLKIARIDMREIMEVKDFDLDKATAQAKKIEELRTAHHLDMLKSMKEVRTILTDEQFAKMKKMMPAMRGGKPGRKMMKGK